MANKAWKDVNLSNSNRVEECPVELGDLRGSSGRYGAGGEELIRALLLNGINGFRSHGTKQKQM